MDQLHECGTTEAVKINWHVVIQDILPTNERLHEIRLVDSPLCRHCGEPDPVQHRVTSCGEWASIWLWNKRRIAWILRIDPAHIAPDWTTRPQFRIWPPHRHRAVLWILVQMVWYRITVSRAHTEQDYSDFCDGHARRRIRPNIAGPSSGTILRSYDHEPIRRTHRGVAASG